jgi:hypothetical protein
VFSFLLSVGVRVELITVSVALSVFRVFGRHFRLCGWQLTVASAMLLWTLLFLNFELDVLVLVITVNTESKLSLILVYVLKLLVVL